VLMRTRVVDVAGRHGPALARDRVARPDDGQRPVRAERTAHQVAVRIEAVLVLNRMRRSSETRVGFRADAKTSRRRTSRRCCSGGNRRRARAYFRPTRPTASRTRTCGQGGDVPLRPRLPMVRRVEEHQPVRDGVAVGVEPPVDIQGPDRAVGRHLHRRPGGGAVEGGVRSHLVARKGVTVVGGDVGPDRPRLVDVGGDVVRAAVVGAQRRRRTGSPARGRPRDGTNPSPSACSRVDRRSALRRMTGRRCTARAEAGARALT